jgi:hypothetical protein
VHRLRTPLGPKEHRAGVGRWVAGGLTTLVAATVLVAVALGAPLVSILLVGLVLLCPLLMWAPFRIRRPGIRTLDEIDEKRRA